MFVKAFQNIFKYLSFALGCSLQIYFSLLSLCLSISLFIPQDGSWNLSPQLGKILKFDVDYLVNHFLIRKGIQSLGKYFFSY